jgi:cytosine/adenosine deaminase-related metal-dependent hydrolase
MKPTADGATVLILGQSLWADTTQPPKPEHGLAIHGGRILATGPHEELGASYPEAQVVAAGDCVITPAFTNAHHHMYGVLAHGIPLDEAPAGFWPFLEDFWWPRVEDQLTHELISAATDWACLEMVRSGVTTFYDCLEAPYALPGALEVEANLVRDWGLRGVLSFEATQRVSDGNGEQGLRENADFYDACRERNDLVSGMICFHTTFTCDAEFIRRVFAVASEREARVHMHLSEGTYEPEYCLGRFGLRPVAYYDHLELLGPRVLASQCVQVDASEIGILAQRGVHVSHQPLSNCEVGGGFAPVPEMLAAGVNVALGTDGYVNNFFEVMRAAALVPKARLLDPGTMPAAAVWTMATQNGSRALGFDDLGTLEPGSQADLLLIRADLPTPLAPHNMADQLLLWRNPSDLCGVMCAGRWLLWDGEVLDRDPEAIGTRVATAAEHLWTHSRSAA